MLKTDALALLFGLQCKHLRAYKHVKRRLGPGAHTHPPESRKVMFQRPMNARVTYSSTSEVRPANAPRAMETIGLPSKYLKEKRQRKSCIRKAEK